MNKLLNFKENREIFDRYVRTKAKEISQLEETEAIRQNGNANRAKLKEYEISDLSATKLVRNNNLEVKKNHTYRIINDIVTSAHSMDIEIDDVLKTAALLHDYSRFDQAVHFDSFIEAEKNMNHSLAGYKSLFEDGAIKDYSIATSLYSTISPAILYHQNSKIPEIFDRKLSIKELKNLKTSLTLIKPGNNHENLIASVTLQLLKDVDMLDIMYQLLTKEMVATYDYLAYKVYFPKTKELTSLASVAGKFGSSIDEILNFNNITYEDFNKLLDRADEQFLIDGKNNPVRVNVPLVKEQAISNLVVPEDIKAAIFAGKSLDLRTLLARQDWHFITGLWWRISEFLNHNVKFYGTLQSVLENDLLNKTYEMYPDSIKPFIKEIIDFGQNEIVEKKLKENNGKIYVK